MLTLQNLVIIILQSQHAALMKKYYDSRKEIPPEEEVAEILGVTANRLRTALRVTRPLLSIDGTLYGPTKGSGAGGDSMGASDLLVSDTLQW